MAMSRFLHFQRLIAVKNGGPSLDRIGYRLWRYPPFGVRWQSGTSVLRIFSRDWLVAPDDQPVRARRRFGFQPTWTKAPSPRCAENVAPPLPDQLWPLAHSL